MDDPKTLRKAAKDFALEAYGKVKNNRLYALNEAGKVALAALARAMFVQRPWNEFSMTRSHRRPNNNENNTHYYDISSRARSRFGASTGNRSAARSH
jgi:hypothetical protein